MINHHFIATLRISVNIINEDSVCDQCTCMIMHYTLIAQRQTLEKCFGKYSLSLVARPGPTQQYSTELDSTDLNQDRPQKKMIQNEHPTYYYLPTSDIRFTSSSQNPVPESGQGNTCLFGLVTRRKANNGSI